MFFDKKNTQKIEELEKEIKELRREFEHLKLDVEIYHTKLKSIKGIKPVSKEQVTESENFNNPVILPE